MFSHVLFYAAEKHKSTIMKSGIVVESKYSRQRRRLRDSEGGGDYDRQGEGWCVHCNTLHYNVLYNVQCIRG